MVNDDECSFFFFRGLTMTLVSQEKVHNQVRQLSFQDIFHRLISVQHPRTSYMSSSTSSTLSSAHSTASSLEQEGIVSHFQHMGRSFLGNAEFNNHFFAVPDGKDAKNVKFEISDGVPFKFHLYGVLLPQAAGTKINAAGNYNGGEGTYVRNLYRFLPLHWTNTIKVSTPS